MLQVPDWLFIVLTTLSILLLVTLLACLISCIIVRMKRNARHIPMEHQFLMQDQFINGHSSPSYIPYTVPKIVQSRASKESNSTYTMNFPLSGRYYAESIKSANYANSCHSEPAINQVSLAGERFHRQYSKTKEPYLRSFSQVSSNHKMSSRPSSRASSLRSEPVDHIELEQNQNGTHSKEVYLHSSLLQAESPEEDAKDQFFPDEHVVSYDQDTDIKDDESKFPNGALVLSLFYDTDASELSVIIRQAIDLPVTDTNKENLEIYVNFCILPEDFYWQRTQSVMHTRNPVFEQTFHIPDVLHHKLRQYTLCFLVMDSSGLHEKIIGKVMVPLSELRAGIDLDICRELGCD